MKITLYGQNSKGEPVRLEKRTRKNGHGHKWVAENAAGRIVCQKKRFSTVQNAIGFVDTGAEGASVYKQARSEHRQNTVEREALRNIVGQVAEIVQTVMRAKKSATVTAERLRAKAEASTGQVAMILLEAAAAVEQNGKKVLEKYATA